MSQGMLPAGAVHPDITSYHCRGRATEAQAFLGGFPCQDFQLHTKGQPLMSDCVCAHILEIHPLQYMLRTYPKLDLKKV